MRTRVSRGLGAVLSGLVVLTLVVIPVRATVLTFDIYDDAAKTDYAGGSTSPNVNGLFPVPIGYGDTVTNFNPAGQVSGAAGPKYVSYGSGGGLTPNITTDYRWVASADHSNTGYSDFYMWSDFYGNLSNVSYRGNGGPPTWAGIMTFKPWASFYQVGIDSFDVAAYVAPLAAEIQIWQDFGTVNEQMLWTTGNVTFPSGATHNAYSPNLVAPGGSSLTIYMLTNGNIGIDNIQFHEVALPEPTVGLAALAVGLPLMMSRNRRSRIG